MSTHASITLYTNDNKVKSIYVHYDGYIKGGVGETLWFGYDTYQAVESLFTNGNGYDIRILGLTSDETEYFNDHNVGANNPIPEDSKVNLYEYNYLFADGKWYVYDGEGIIMGALADCLK